MYAHLPFWWLFGVLGVRTRVIVSLMDLRLELLFWMSACDFCILNECVCALLWSSWLGWCQPGFCFHQGKADWAIWYPHCALCVSAEEMELHLQGSSGGNLWLLDSNPPPNIPLWRNIRPQPPSPTTPLLMFLHLPYKSPGFPPYEAGLLRRTPLGGLPSLGSCLISEHDATAPGSISIMFTVLIYVTDVCFESTWASKQTVNHW